MTTIVLLAGFLNLALVAAAAESGRKIEPFTTRTGLLAVTVVVHRNAPPEITTVEPLSAGRLSVTQAGEYTLTVENAQGQPVYVLPFQAVFVMPGIHRASLDEMRVILVVPGGEDVVRIVVAGPEGTGVYQLPQEFDAK